MRERLWEIMLLQLVKVYIYSSFAVVIPQNL